MESHLQFKKNAALAWHEDVESYQGVTQDTRPPLDKQGGFWPLEPVSEEGRGQKVKTNNKKTSTALDTHVFPLSWGAFWKMRLHSLPAMLLGEEGLGSETESHGP
jgi:hypothetical protein